MKYLNQLDYEYMYYPTNVANGGLGEEGNTVKAAGCGLCSCCMIVENMTLAQFSLPDCLRMAIELKANQQPGTDMKILGPAVAEKFGLDYSTTSDKQELLNHLYAGGMAIANVGGDREGYNGVFSKGGHYITVLSAEGDTVCIFDPSQKPDKFETEDRKGKVVIDGHFIYCSIEVLAMDTDNRTPSYYLFKRAVPKA